MNPLTKETFMALWGVLLDNFRQKRNDMTVAFIYQALLDQDPGLTTEQFGYAVQKCLISCTFMPSVNELLRQLYEPDLDGGPVMPDIDPKYADEYQLSQYNAALNIRSKWEAQHDNQPKVGRFRADRVKEIPGLPTEEIAKLPAGCSWTRGDEKLLAGIKDGPTDFDFPLVFEETRARPGQHQAEMALETAKRKAINELRQAA